MDLKVGAVRRTVSDYETVTDSLDMTYLGGEVENYTGTLIFLSVKSSVGSLFVDIHLLEITPVQRDTTSSQVAFGGVKQNNSVASQRDT